MRQLVLAVPLLLSACAGSSAPPEVAVGAVSVAQCVALDGLFGNCLAKTDSTGAICYADLEVDEILGDAEECCAADEYAMCEHLASLACDALQDVFRYCTEENLATGTQCIIIMENAGMLGGVRRCCVAGQYGMCGSVAEGASVDCDGLDDGFGDCITETDPTGARCVANLARDDVFDDAVGCCEVIDYRMCRYLAE